VAVLAQAGGTAGGVAELVAAALLEQPSGGRQQAHVVERAQALQRLEAQQHGIAGQGRCQVRLHVPAIADDDAVGAEGVHRGAVAGADGRHLPVGLGELQRLAVRQVAADGADAPGGEAGEEVAHGIAGAGQEVGQFGSVDIAAAG